MTQYRVRTANDLLTIECTTYIIDTNGLRLLGVDNGIIASFPTYESFVKVDAMVSDTVKAEEPVTETAQAGESQ